MGLFDGLGAACDAEFAVQVFNVGADGVFGDEQRVFDLFVGEASNNELQDFAFTGGELDERISESGDRQKG